MRRIDSLIFVIFFISSLFGIILFLYGYHLRDSNIDHKIYKELSSKLKSCFDLDNKFDRTPEDSIKLIEYCMDIYRVE